MKKNLRILVAIMLIMVTTFGMNLEASAITLTYEGKITRRADLPDVIIDGFDCRAVNAMGVSRKANCLFTIKISSNEERAILYYFHDITKWDEYIWMELEGVGHANGMTVDTNHIYICTSSNETTTTPNNKVVRIFRDDIEMASEGDVFSVAEGNMYEMNVVTISNDQYIPYTDKFSTIARDNDTGTFIIGKSITNVTDSKEYNGFTRAEVDGANFVVSSDTSDMFLVENNIDYKNAAKQDICYVSGSGLFIGRWYRNYSNTASDNAQRNPTENYILWADIEGNPDYQYMGYDCYTPDKIAVDVTGYIDEEFNVVKYSFFEIESLGITAKRNLIATFNVDYTTAYENAYEAKYGSAPIKDGIYKITKTDGSKFILS